MQPQEQQAGDPAIDDALARTESLDGVPLAEHVGRFDAVHGALNDALSRIDTD
ncbi:hypothetical protein [Actinophytocola xanthii]|uniref:hypothetical protein n=1 Tax=Actinophytocola xanthii TaxID=1912961 RepID=UPI0018E92086|nr:hypothetical protein [Actinophytocola xanthii]